MGRVYFISLGIELDALETLPHDSWDKVLNGMNASSDFLLIYLFLEAMVQK